MPSVLNVDTLVAANGTDPVTLTKQSAAKTFFQCNLAGPTLEQSLNIASVTDVQSARHEFNFSTSFAQRTYAAVCGGGGDTLNNTLANVATATPGKTTSKITADTQYAQMTVFEPTECAIVIHGDLA
jgi:hypothetical protein